MFGSEKRAGIKAFSACQIKETIADEDTAQVVLSCKGPGNGMVGENGYGKGLQKLAKDAGKHACSTCIFSGKAPEEVSVILTQRAEAEMIRLDTEVELAKKRLAHEQTLTEIAQGIEATRQARPEILRGPEPPQL